MLSPKNPELVFSSDGGQHEVVLTDAYAQAHIPGGKTILIELPSECKE